jgi:O-antigen/teichoic acid export membrane protein
MSFPLAILLFIFAIGFYYFIFKNQYGTVAAKKLLPSYAVVALIISLVFPLRDLSTISNQDVREILYIVNTFAKMI